MAINKYDNPAVQPVRDAIPNVSALPFDAIAGSIKMREDTYNKNRAAAMEAQGALSVMGKALQVDQANRNKVLDSYDKHMKELVDSANGDYSVITEGIQDLIHSAKQDMTSGTLAAYGTSYANRNAEVADATKKLQEEKHTSGTPVFTAASKFKQDANFAYFNARGGTTVNPDGSYNTYEPTEMSRTVDTNTVLSQLVNGWHADGYITEDNKGGWLVKEQAKGIPAIDVRSAATQQLYNQPGYQEMLKDEYMYKNSSYYMNDARLKGLIDAGDMQGASQLFQVQVAELQKQRSSYIGNINADIAQLDAVLKQDPNHKQALAAKEQLLQRRQHLADINLESVGGQEYFENIMYNDYATKRTSELVEPYVSKIAYEELSTTKTADPYALMAAKYRHIGGLLDTPETNIPTVAVTTGSTQKVYDENELQKMRTTYNDTINTSRINQANLVSSAGKEGGQIIESSFKANMSLEEFRAKNPSITLQKAYADYVNEKSVQQEAELNRNRTVVYRQDLVKNAETAGTFTFNSHTGEKLNFAAVGKPYEMTSAMSKVLRQAFDKGMTTEEFLKSPEMEVILKLAGAQSPFVENARVNTKSSVRNAIRQMYETNYEQFKEASKPTAQAMNTAGGYKMNFQNINNDFTKMHLGQINAMLSQAPTNFVGVDGRYLGDDIYALGRNKNPDASITGRFIDGKPVYGVKIPSADGKTFTTQYGTFGGDNTTNTNMFQLGNSMLIADHTNSLKTAVNSLASGGVGAALQSIKAAVDSPTFTYGLALVGSSAYGKEIGKLQLMAPVTDNTTLTNEEGKTRLVSIPFGSGYISVGRQGSKTPTGSSSYVVYTNEGKVTFQSEQDLLSVLGLFKFDNNNYYSKPSTTAKQMNNASAGQAGTVQMINNLAGDDTGN